MNKKKVQSLIHFILNMPFLTWVFLPFFISYLIIFVRPIFLTGSVMQFPSYIPELDPIGRDLKQMLSFSELWFITKESPYIEGNLYTPLSTLLFTPLLIVKKSLAYIIVTFINVVLYVLITFIFPLQINKNKQASSILTLILITGLFSYGFQFELERGQFNVITMFFCFLSIWIYHYHNKYRYFAYFLFTIAIQLKVYPIIFSVMFITNWRDWRKIIKKFFLLSLVNFGLLYILGSNVFFDFITAIKENIVNPYIWLGNHSVLSFVTLLSESYVVSIHCLPCSNFLNQYSGFIVFLLISIITVCIIIILLQAYISKQKGLNSHLFLACTIGALIIPSVSHDYKLSILGGPIALLFSDKSFFSEKSIKISNQIIYFVLIFILSSAYFSTLFSFTNKPHLIDNNFPALILMLFSITFLSLISKSSSHDEIINSI